MKINTALILCAGYGKRLNPLTLNDPKPLLKINKISLLENCINLIETLEIKKIIINTFYLKDKITNFLATKNFISLRAQKKPSIYDTAYQRSARFIPNNSKENISGLISGNRIILFLNLTTF